MDQSTLSFNYPSRRRDEEAESYLREWALIANKISSSRRHSASNITSSREDAKSFRSTITKISSTSSSPGCPLIRDEIDPSTYSFTNAIKALQAKSFRCSWECLSQDGSVLKSKWSEAEKYICNPISGEVPIECLSAKPLTNRSFRKFNGRVPKSAPLIFANHLQKVQTEPKYCVEVPYPSTQALAEKNMKSITKDASTQTGIPDLSSSASPMLTLTPPVREPLEQFERDCGESPHSAAKTLNSAQQVSKVKDVGMEKETKREKNGKQTVEGKCKCGSKRFRLGCLALRIRIEKHQCRNTETHQNSHEC